jgi:hypothetical protein
VFPPEMLSIEQIEHELFLNQATKYKKDDNVETYKNEKNHSLENETSKKQIDDIHRTTFPPLKTLSKEEQIKTRQDKILKSKAKKKKVVT